MFRPPPGVRVSHEDGTALSAIRWTVDGATVPLNGACAAMPTPAGRRTAISAHIDMLTQQVAAADDLYDALVRAAGRYPDPAITLTGLLPADSEHCDRIRAVTAALAASALSLADAVVEDHGRRQGSDVSAPALAYRCALALAGAANCQSHLTGLIAPATPRRNP